MQEDWYKDRYGYGETAGAAGYSDDSSDDVDSLDGLDAQFSSLGLSASSSSASRAAPSQGDHFDGGAYEFRKITLGWSLDTIRSPLSSIHYLQKQPDAYYAAASYYEGFKPLILEEARATIYQGLEAYDEGKSRPVNVKMVYDAKIARNPGNPSELIIYGKIPSKPDFGKAQIAVLINIHGRELLGVVGEDKVDGRLRIKLIFPEGQGLGQLFKKDVKFEISMLGCLVSYERMYDACCAQTHVPFMQEVLTAQLKDWAHVRLSKMPERLNEEQVQVVHGFPHLDFPDGLYLLQGPPGTGKTTTVVSLLERAVKHKKRVLVCAPSNKAVQVIAKRFLIKCPQTAMALAGVEKKLDPILRPIFIHGWGGQMGHMISGMVQSLRCQDVLRVLKAKQYTKKMDFEEIRTEIVRSINACNSMRFTPILEALTRSLGSVSCVGDKPTCYYAALKAYSAQLKSLTDAQWKAVMQFAKNRKARDELPDCIYEADRQFQLAITHLDSMGTTLNRMNDVEDLLLNNASVVFCTLAVAGRHNMLKMNQVDFLIVDEAGQAVEAETLIAMRHQPKRCLLVGDTNQLPATVISQHAADLNFDRSMMWRMMEDNHTPHKMLITQYRMHPEIRAWPSRKFYGGRLVDGGNVLARPPCAPVLNASPLFGPYSFVNVQGQERIYAKSYCNENEAALVIQMLQHLARNKVDMSRVGVITFYSGQVELISDHIRRMSGKLFNQVLVHTVDGFQGDERDIIIISFVRANPKQRIGFLKDFRRLNVAVTRARHHLIMFGHAPTLQSNDLMGSLVRHAARHQCFHEAALVKKEIIPRAVSAPVLKGVKIKKKAKGKPKQAPAKKAARPNNYKMMLCKFFKPKQVKSCPRGARCTYAHGQEERQHYQGLMRQAAPAQAVPAKRPARAAAAKAAPARRAPAKRLPAKRAPARAGRKAALKRHASYCRFFIKKQVAKCSKGRKCFFAHSEQQHQRANQGGK